MLIMSKQFIHVEQNKRKRKANIEQQLIQTAKQENTFIIQNSNYGLIDIHSVIEFWLHTFTTIPCNLSNFTIVWNDFRGQNNNCFHSIWKRQKLKLQESNHDPKQKPYLVFKSWTWTTNSNISL